MRTLVHFASDDLVDEFEDDLTDARRRLVDGALARGVHFGVGVGDDAVVLGLTATGRFGPDLIRGGLGGGDDLAGLVPRRGEELRAFVAGRGRFGLGGVGGGQ